MEYRLFGCSESCSDGDVQGSVGKPGQSVPILSQPTIAYRIHSTLREARVMRPKPFDDCLKSCQKILDGVNALVPANETPIHKSPQ